MRISGNDTWFGIALTAAIFIGMAIVYIAGIVITVFAVGYTILWLLQYFHVLGMGCVC
jgi:hypothetical protein